MNLCFRSSLAVGRCQEDRVSAEFHPHNRHKAGQVNDLDGHHLLGVVVDALVHLPKRALANAVKLVPAHKQRTDALPVCTPSSQRMQGKGRGGLHCPQELIPSLCNCQA
ncbi:hypothetical protein A6R68_20593 [Neotoma lepida]|uniref:Uncharacterized protein n=1 Tax=Neotoma lepida TaxID=56216 RepID=A0A1A6HTY3_NEOLE|nr:hypothetical protein A6R68_20593 [Neotoma lepida]